MSAHQWPLYFSHRESVEGKGFVAVVSMQGRCLAAREERTDDGGDAWVLYGVQPASLSAEGDSLPSAFAAFRECLKDILFSYADDSANYEEFRATIDAFFDDTDADAETWTRLAAEIRAGKAVEETAISGLPKRVLHETAPVCTVGVLNYFGTNQTFTPSPANNALSEIQLAAA